MLKAAIFYVVVIGAPLVLIVYFFFKVSTIVVVHNTGAEDISVSLVIDGLTGTERTDEKPARAGWLLPLSFTPQTEGKLSITCNKAGHRHDFELGQGSTTSFVAIWATLKSCERLVSKKVYAF